MSPTYRVATPLDRASRVLNEAVMGFLGQVAFGIAMGMAISLYVFAIKGWLR